MIKIEIGKPDKIQPTHFSPNSGFISFPYNFEIIQYIKSLSNRVYNPKNKTWEVPQTLISKVCNDLSNFDIEISGEMVKHKPFNTNVLPKDFEFKTQPFKHQLEGVIFGLNNDTFLLGDEQGLGKTKQGIDLALIKKKENGFKHCLIVCGVNGNKYNWEDEINTHSNESSWILGSRFTKRENKRREGGSRDKLDDLNNLPDDFFLITNIETMRGLSKRKGRKKIFPIAEKIKQLCESGVIGMIIFDECHKSKNPDSDQGKAMLKIKADNMIAMSGTPLMNNPLDLYFPLKWLGYESHSFYQYKNFYCKLGGFGGREVIGYKNLGNLRQIVDKIMLRRLKSEVLDLPPKVHKVEYVEMDKNQTKIYNEVKGELIENIDKIKLSNNPLAMMIRLRQATAYPGILSSSHTESAKMDRMVEVVEDAVSNGSKCIIFSNWEQVTEVAKEKLAKYNPGYITGKVDTEQRMEHINRFQNDESCKVIIGTIGAMGTGLTLNAASEVIFLDSPWNRALKDQAEDRAHRIGTKGTVTVTTIVCKDTIDERIEDIVYKKGKMSDMLVDGNANKQDSKTIVNYILS